VRNAVIAALLLVTAVTGCEGEGPVRFRHTNYMAFVPEPGKTVTIQLTSVPIGKYTDPLKYRILNSESDVELSGTVGVGGKQEVTFSPKQSGLHVLELDAGWNSVACDVSIPHAIVCHSGVILKTVRALDKLYFYVPTGTKQFTLHLQASVRGEGLAYRVLDPTGREASSGQGDYDRVEKVKITVPPGTDSKAWSLSILRPEQKGIGLDDTEIYLGKELAPYLAPKPDWAVTFGKRKHP